LQRLLSARDPLLHPRRVLKRAVYRQRDPLATDIHPLVPAPHLLLDRLVVQARVVRGHLDRTMIQHLLNHRQRNLVIDHARPHVVAKQMRMHAERELATDRVDARRLDIALDDPIDRARRDVERATLAVAPARRRGGKQPFGALAIQ
jgi:hypothetical protein